MTKQNAQTQQEQRETVFLKRGSIKAIVLEKVSDTETKVTFFSPYNDKKRMIEVVPNNVIEPFDPNKHPDLIRKRKVRIAKQKEQRKQQHTQSQWSEKEAEIILVTPRATLFENESLTFQGVIISKEQVERIGNNLANNIAMMRRIYAEENPTFKQPIPYTVVRKGNNIYTYKRLSGSGETRLHDKLSIGVGGHQNEVLGRSFLETIETNLWRELKEELEIKCSTSKLETIGLINDDLNPVGKVHLGLLNVLTLDNAAEVTVRETDALEGEWMTVEQLLQPENFERLESWSQMAVSALK